MSNPKISIITTTYNGSKFIRKTIDSVLNQSFNNFEYIIIDDASKDNMKNIILKYQQNDNRIHYVKNEINSERAVSRNKWISLSKWEYIAFVDDDDIWCDKEKLQKQVNFLDNNKDYVLVWTNINLINWDWEIIDWNWKLRTTDKSIRNNMLKSWQFCFSSIMLRKSILEKSWLFNEDRKIIECEDHDLNLRIWIHGKFENLNSICVSYRWFFRNLTYKKIFKKKIISFYLFLKYVKYYPGKISWLIANIVNLLFPNSIIAKLVLLNKKLTKNS